MKNSNNANFHSGVSLLIDSSIEIKKIRIQKSYPRIVVSNEQQTL